MFDRKVASLYAHAAHCLLQIEICCFVEMQLQILATVLLPVITLIKLHGDAVMVKPTLIRVLLESILEMLSLKNHFVVSAA